MARTVPVALTIAGSDSSGGAGIQADLKTFASLGVYGTSAVTAVVAENSKRVARIDPMPAASVKAQLETIFEEFPVAAMKTGMLFSAENILAISKLLEKKKGIPLVIDPVLISSSGTNLLQPQAISILEQKLFPLARLITPNLAETAFLLRCDVSELRSSDDLQQAGKILSKGYGVAFLIKGGHLTGKAAIDFLCEGKKTRPFTTIRIKNGHHVRGTGCTLSAAITAGLAKSYSLGKAVEMGKKFVTKVIQNEFNQ